uniref:Uncharacterized protein n=1 Tax=Latimeria chalumnae TaxID=7897 RepID=H3A4J4_LATCH
PLTEVHWLSCHFAGNALLQKLLHCAEVNENNDPIAKYCLKKLTDPQYRIALTVLDDILGELSELCQTFQRSCLTTIEAYRYAKAKIAKFCSQCLGEKVHWKQQMTSFANTVNTRVVLHSITELCEHLGCQFPENELQEWAAFDTETLFPAKFNYGTENVTKLVGKYQAVLNLPTDGSITECICKQYIDYKFIIVEKMKAGAIRTFANMVTYMLKEEQFTDLTQFVDICGTFQASSADCECGFRLMNQIKAKSRNRLGVNHMDQLIRIKYYLAANGDVNLDKIYHHWTIDKYRREK